MSTIAKGFLIASAVASLSLALSVAARASAQSDWKTEVQPMGWIFLDTAGDDSANFYWRTAPRAPGSDKARLWVREEDRQPVKRMFTQVGGFSQPQPSMSIMWLEEIDCAQVRTRTLQWNGYTSRNLAGDATTSAVPNPDWTYPGPGTVDEEIAQIACRNATPKPKAATTRR